MLWDGHTAAAVCERLGLSRVKLLYANSSEVVRDLSNDIRYDNGSLVCRDGPVAASIYSLVPQSVCETRQI